MVQAAMANRDTIVTELCEELGIKPMTLYRYVGSERIPARLRQTHSRRLGCHSLIKFLPDSLTDHGLRPIRQAKNTTVCCALKE